MTNTGPFGTLEKSWNLLLFFGILSIVLGVIGLGMAVFLTLASVMFYGFMLLVGGGAQLMQSTKSSGWRARTWHVMIALLYLLAGIVVIRNPILASRLLTLVLAGAFVAVGIFRIAMAFQSRGASGWMLLLLGGILALILGAWMLARLDTLSLVIIGLFISIELIANGWSAITLALAAKSAAPR